MHALLHGGKLHHMNPGERHSRNFMGRRLERVDPVANTLPDILVKEEPVCID